MVLGLASIIAIGVLHGRGLPADPPGVVAYPEAVAGALFLFSGAVFPLAVLPLPLQAIGLAEPAGVVDRRRPAARSSRAGRRGSAAPAACGPWSPAPPRPMPPTIVIALLVTGALVTLAATGIFRSSERRAKDRGLLDRTTGS